MLLVVSSFAAGLHSGAAWTEKGPPKRGPLPISSTNPHFSRKLFPKALPDPFCKTKTDGGSVRGAFEVARQETSRPFHSAEPHDLLSFLHLVLHHVISDELRVLLN